MLDEPIPFIACVPLVLDHDSAGVISSYPGSAFPSGYVETILRSRDPYKSGLDAAIRLSTDLLGVAGVRGINLASAYTEGSELETVRALGAIGQHLGAGR